MELVAGRRVEVFVFLATFVSFAYFHPGGGWNQNGRFAQVRALVEEGRFSIDSFLIYGVDRTEPTARRLSRATVRDQEVSRGGVSYALAWVDATGKRVPLRASSDLPAVDLNSVAVSGDVASVNGHLYPNKAPGTTFLAVPAYFLLHHLGKLIGVHPDDWWTLTVNAWLTSALSVGLLSAVGCVLFLRTATVLSGARELPALLATAGFAWGTLFFPYATMLYEHDVMAVAFLAAFWLLLAAAVDDGRAAYRSRHALCAGMCAGCGIAANYLGLPVALLFALYAFQRLGSRNACVFVSGLIPPLAVVGLYQLACFGTPWTISYSRQNPTFQGTGLFLGVFGPPRLDVLAALLFSPFRGLFYTSPLLLAGVAGWFWLVRDARWKAEALLFAGIFLVFLGFNVCFHYWEGGWAPGPRYLVPALPFLALPLALAFDRFTVATSILAVLSVGAMLLVTAVDPATPILLKDPLWRSDPLLSYELPLFLENPLPLIEAETQSDLILYDRTISASGISESERISLRERARQELAAAARRGDTRLFPASTRRGPVSASPLGVYEPNAYFLFPADSEVAAWNAFNAGEFLFPKSRWSLLPLLLLSGCLFLAAVRSTASR